MKISNRFEVNNFSGKFQLFYSILFTEFDQNRYDC